MTAIAQLDHRITGDLGPDAGPLLANTDVVIAGNVFDGAEIKTPATVFIHGACEAARIEAATIRVKGGVLGKSVGRFFAASSIAAKFASFANFECLGNIEIESEIVQSAIFCRGKLNIPNGIINGGRVAANGGITCRVLGSPGGAATDAGVGFDAVYNQSIESELTKLENKLKVARDVRARVEPLMRQQKLLSPAQKEKAVELLYEAGEAESRATAALNAMKESIDQIDAMSLPELIITETLHANVTIRFRGAHAVTRNGIKGPVKLTFNKTQMAICATELEANRTCFFDTILTADPTLAIRGALSKLA